MASEALTQALTPATTSAVEPATPVSLLNSPAMLTQITEALPRHMDADAFRRSAITLVKQNPKLLECEPTSVAQSIVRGASLGLDPDPVLGQMYLVPRNTKTYNPATRKDEWHNVATFQIGYKGLYELAMRTGKVAKIEVAEVREHDHFVARRGTNGGLDHQPDWFGDRGQIVGWYAFVRLTDGSEQFAVLNVAQAEAHRDAYAPKKRDGTVYGPWVDNFSEMAEKTVFIKAAKWVPKSKELTNALAIDGTATLAPLGAPIRQVDVIEATHTPLAAVAEVEAGAPDDDLPSGDDSYPLGHHQNPHPPSATTPMADENGEPIEASGGEADPDPDAAARNRKMWALVADAWPDEDQAGRDKRRKGLIRFVGSCDSSKDLDEAGWRDLFDSLELIAAGSHELHLTSNGEWDFRPKVAKRASVPKSSGPAHRVTA